jgi:hypothetical protein
MMFNTVEMASEKEAEKKLYNDFNNNEENKLEVKSKSTPSKNNP